MLNYDISLSEKKYGKRIKSMVVYKLKRLVNSLRGKTYEEIYEGIREKLQTFIDKKHLSMFRLLPIESNLDITIYFAVTNGEYSKFKYNLRGIVNEDSTGSPGLHQRNSA